MSKEKRITNTSRTLDALEPRVGRETKGAKKWQRGTASSVACEMCDAEWRRSERSRRLLQLPKNRKVA